MPLTGHVKVHNLNHSRLAISSFRPVFQVMEKILFKKLMKRQSMLLFNQKVKSYGYPRIYVFYHILGRFYTLDVLVGSGDSRSPRDPYHILSDIHSILADSAKKGHIEHPVSTLSSVDRDTWTAARKELIRLGNADALAEIDDAMFCLSLDDFSGIYIIICIFITKDKHMNPQMLMSRLMRVSIGDIWKQSVRVT